MKPAYTILYIIAALLITACSSRKAKEHYLEGEALVSQHRTAEAMRSFQKAINAKDDKFYVVSAISQMGHLCLNQHDSQQARTYFNQALSLSDQWQLPSARVLARRDLGRLCQMEGKPEESLRYFATADSLIAALQADSLYAQVYPEYLSLLIATREKEQACALISNWHIDRLSGPSCLVAGRFYRQLGMTDSAYYYFERCLETDNVTSRASAAMFLSEMASDSSEWEQAYDYAMECAVLVDSTKHAMQYENANLVASLINQMEVERENNRLYIWLAVAITLLAGLSVTSWFYVRWRIEQLRRKQATEKAVRQERARSRQALLTEHFHDTPLYRHILANEAVSDEQWTELTHFLEEEANHFPSALQKFYPRIKPLELQACQLIKLEFTNQQIAAILCKTQQAITNLRKRLYQKIFDHDGTAEELNQFLRMFPEK